MSNGSPSTRACAAPVPGHDLLLVEGVAQAKHRSVVNGLGEAGYGLRAYALCGRVRGHQLGVALLDGSQLPEERVELGVAYLGRVEGVVAVVVVVDLGPELFEPAVNVLVRQEPTCSAYALVVAPSPSQAVCSPALAWYRHGG